MIATKAATLGLMVNWQSVAEDENPSPGQ